MAVVSCRNLTKEYRSEKGSVLALDDIDLDINDGEFCTIIGPSGCGKTTLLRIIDGLIKPTSGEVLLNGEPIEGSGQDRGMVFQNFNLFPWRTVKENISIGLEAKGTQKQERNQIIQEYIDLVGLTGFEDNRPQELSGGMQQRVGLARALAIDPEILLMDEPFGALDALTREEMQTELLKTWSAAKKTTVFITHDIAEAVFLSDRVVVMTDRPGQVKDDIEIPFPRPRYETGLKGTAEFSHFRDDIASRLNISLIDKQAN